MNKKNKKMVKVIWNWNDIKSIREANKLKARLENQGYTLVDTFNSTNKSSLIYVKFQPRY